MPGSFATTTRFALRKLLGTSKVSDIDEGFSALAEDVDQKMLGYVQDTLAKRPAAGIPNRIFKATDTGALQHDTGSSFEPLLGPGADRQPSAQAIITSGEPGSFPSPYRWAQVFLQIECLVAATSVAIWIGTSTFRQITAAASSQTPPATGAYPFSFWLPPGVGWYWTLGEGSARVAVSYLLA